MKNAHLEKGVKVNHLSYVGDASIGASTNVGAGVITCNYDGVSKHQTEIGQDVLIGSNTALIAPICIGDGAYIGAGSIISEDVESKALSLTRTPQKHIRQGAERLRARLLNTPKVTEER